MSKNMNKFEILGMITRIPLPPGQICLLKALYESDVPLSKRELAMQMRENDLRSLNTLLLAFAKRILRGGKDFEVDEVLKEVFEVSNDGYSLRAECREAIRSCPDLLEIILTNSFEDIYKKYGRYPSDKSKYPQIQCD